MLLTGECDVAVRGAGDPDFGARTPFVVRAHEQGLLQAAYTASARWVHLDFGINPGPDYDRPDFFEDARVRQALAQCIDREAIASALSYGRGAAVHSFVPPGHLLYADDGLSLWPHNPRAADRLLSEVGWRDEDHDGWLEAHDVEGIRDEQPFAVTLRAPEGYELLAQMIQADLMDCGIRVEVETLPSEELLTPGPESPLFGRQFDLAVFAWQLSEEPHCQLYASGEIPTDENGWVAANISGYSDPGYDEVCGAARQSLPGLPEYDEHHRQAQVLFSEALPAIPLFLELEIAAARPEVRNLILDPTEEGEMWNVELFDIEER